MNLFTELLVLSYEIALDDEESYNESAWNRYGSELCAGDMIGRERYLASKIKEFKEILF